MKTIFKLGYSSEDFDIDYGFFTTLKKAEKAKSNIIKTVDTDLQEYFIREIYIQELLLNELLNK